MAILQPANPRKALHQEFIIIGIGVLVFILVAIFLIYQIKTSAGKINQMRIDAATKTAQLALSSELSTQYDVVLPYIEKLENILPRRDEMINFDRTLIALAKSQGVGFGFSFGGETPASATNAGAVSFTITLQGSFASIINYLDTLHTLSYFIEFPGVDMSIRGGQYSTRLNGRVFNR